MMWSRLETIRYVSKSVDRGESGEDVKRGRLWARDIVVGEKEVWCVYAPAEGYRPLLVTLENTGLGRRFVIMGAVVEGRGEVATFEDVNDEERRARTGWACTRSEELPSKAKFH
jgi:hypothetical protein